MKLNKTIKTIWSAMLSGFGKPSSRSYEVEPGYVPPVRRKRVKDTPGAFGSAKCKLGKLLTSQQVKAHW